MTAEELRKTFPNASEQFIRANAQLPLALGLEASAPILECDLRPRPLAARKVEGCDPARFLVRVTSYRVRLLDEDNLCAKYVVDCCRYAGLIPGDSPAITQIATGQKKVRSKAEERTEVVIETI
jgi:hypothetical protein